MSKISRKNIEFYLNSMYISETEYVALYNHFASATGAQKLTSVDDIYTDKNDQNALITYIVNNNQSIIGG